MNVSGGGGEGWSHGNFAGVGGVSVGNFPARNFHTDSNHLMDVQFVSLIYQLADTYCHFSSYIREGRLGCLNLYLRKQSLSGEIINAHVYALCSPFHEHYSILSKNIYLS